MDDGDPALDEYILLKGSLGEKIILEVDLGEWIEAAQDKLFEATMTPDQQKAYYYDPAPDPRN